MEFDKVVSIIWGMRVVPFPKWAFRMAADKPRCGVVMGLVCHLTDVHGMPLGHVSAEVAVSV